MCRKCCVRFRGGAYALIFKLLYFKYNYIFNNYYIQYARGQPHANLEIMAVRIRKFKSLKIKDFVKSIVFYMFDE